MAHTWAIGHAGISYGSAIVEDGREPSLIDMLFSYLLDGTQSKKDQEAVKMLSTPLRNFASASPIRTVIIEHGYFDIDYRSEHSINAERQYRFDAPVQDRLHFFDIPLNEAVFNKAIAETESRNQPSAHREGLRKAYIGYTVLRGGHRVTTLMGRSLLRAPENPNLKDPSKTLLRVRTPVQEQVVLFGLPLIAQGVPFMEPDRALLTCANIVAWVAHYSAALKGRVPRRVVGLFTPQAMRGAEQRPYPSAGLTSDQIVDALMTAGLGPEVKRLRAIHKEREVAWYDRTAVKRARFNWKAEALTSNVARYLNSGIPVVLTHASHAVVICGYHRADQLIAKRKVKRKHPDPSRVEEFIVHDDQKGLYVSRRVSACLKAPGETDAIIVPLPPWVWLPGEDAEIAGARYLKVHLERAVNEPEDLDLEAGIAQFQRNAYAWMNSGKLAIRTYVIESSDFKASFFTRCPDPVARKWVALSRLPRFIWVAEMIDRRRRNKNESPVLGEALIDASAPTIDRAETLLVHLPGYLVVRDRVSGKEFGVACGAGYYDSGRWAQSPESFVADWHSVVRHLKQAGT